MIHDGDGLVSISLFQVISLLYLIYVIENYVLNEQLRVNEIREVELRQHAKDVT